MPATAWKTLLLAAVLLVGCDDLLKEPDPLDHTLPATAVDWRRDADLVKAISELPGEWERKEVARYLDVQASLEKEGKPTELVPGDTITTIILRAKDREEAATEGPVAGGAATGGAVPGGAAPPRDAPRPRTIPASIPYAETFRPRDCGDAESDLGSMELYTYCEMIGGLECGEKCGDHLEDELAKLGPPVKAEDLDQHVSEVVADIAMVLADRERNGKQRYGSGWWPVVLDDANHHIHLWNKGSTFDDMGYVPRERQVVGTYRVDVFLDGGPGAVYEVHGAALSLSGKWVHYTSSESGDPKKVRSAP